MNRRQYLSGVLTGATPLVAGCPDEGDKATPEGTTEGVEYNPEKSEKFDEHIRPHTSAAIDSFEKVVKLLQTEAANFDSIESGGLEHKVSKTVSEVETHLSDAKDRLGTASNADYSYAFLWYTHGMQEYARWLGKYVPFLERAANAYDGWVTLHSAWPPQDYKNVRGEFGRVANARDLKQFPTGWEPPEETRERLDNFELEEFQQLDSWSEALEDSFSPLVEWGQTLALTGSGLSTIAQGVPWYIEAVTRYENQRYEGGKNEVAGMANSALGKFEEALTYYEENEDSIPDTYQATYSEYVCFAESMVEAATLRLEASRAAAAGDMNTAQTKTTQAKNARNHCPIE